MRVARCLVAFLLLLVPSLSASAESAPACVKHRTEARYRNLGYDHLVHVRNGCAERVVCRVSTNVNPEPTELPVNAGEEREVLTWRGSPAREFTARVSCRISR